MAHSPSAYEASRTSGLQPGYVRASGIERSMDGGGGAGRRRVFSRQEILEAYRCFTCPDGVQHHTAIFSQDALLPELKGPEPDPTQVVSLGPRNKRPLSDLMDRPRPPRGGDGPATKHQDGSLDSKGFGGRQGDRAGFRGAPPRGVAGDEHGSDSYDRFGVLDNWVSHKPRFPAGTAQPAPSARVQGFASSDADQDWGNVRSQQPHSAASWQKLDQKAAMAAQQAIPGRPAAIQQPAPQQQQQPLAYPTTADLSHPQPPQVSQPLPSQRQISGGQQQPVQAGAAEFLLERFRERFPNKLSSEVLAQIEHQVRTNPSAASSLLGILGDPAILATGSAETPVLAPSQQQQQPLPMVAPQMASMRPTDQQTGFGAEPQSIQQQQSMTFLQQLRQTYQGGSPRGPTPSQKEQPPIPCKVAATTELHPPGRQSAPKPSTPTHKRIVRWSDSRPLFVISSGPVAAQLDHEFTMAIREAQLATTQRDRKLCLERYERHVAQIYAEFFDSRDITLPPPVAEELGIDENTSLALWPTFRELYQTSSKLLNPLSHWERCLSDPQLTTVTDVDLGASTWGSELLDYGAATTTQQPVMPPPQQHPAVTAVQQAAVGRAVATVQRESQQPLAQHVVTSGRSTPLAEQHPQPVPTEQAAATVASLQWEYLDPQGTIRGPFSQLRMDEWWQRRYFPDTLPIRYDPSQPFVPLSTWYPPELQHQFQPFRDLPPVVPATSQLADEPLDPYLQQPPQAAPPPVQPAAHRPTIEQRAPAVQQSRLPQPVPVATAAAGTQSKPKPRPAVVPTAVQPTIKPTPSPGAAAVGVSTQHVRPSAQVPVAQPTSAVAVKPVPRVSVAPEAAPAKQTDQPTVKEAPAPKGFVIPRTASGREGPLQTIDEQLEAQRLAREQNQAQQQQQNVAGFTGAQVSPASSNPPTSGTVWKAVPDPTALGAPVVADADALGPSLAESRFAGDNKGSAAGGKKVGSKKASQKPGKKQSLMEIISEQRAQAAQQPVWGPPRLLPQQASVWHDVAGREQAAAASPTQINSVWTSQPGGTQTQPSLSSLSKVSPHEKDSDDKFHMEQIYQSDEPSVERAAEPQQKDRPKLVGAKQPPAGSAGPTGTSNRGSVSSAPGSVPTPEEWMNLCAHHGLALDTEFAEVLAACSSQSDMCSMLNDNLPDADPSAIDAFAEDFWDAVRNPFKPVKKGLNLNAGRGTARKRGGKRK